MQLPPTTPLHLFSSVQSQPKPTSLHEQGGWLQAPEHWVLLAHVQPKLTHWQEHGGGV